MKIYTDVCMECGEEYDIAKSDAREPEWFCSATCETKHDAFKADWEYDRMRDK